jgi:EAL and modified HD-GYP domain-containing signal transduction protein
VSVAFVARQAIFDFDDNLVGYELLYRPTPQSVEAGSQATQEAMSASTIVNAVLSIGLSHLTGTKPAWVNFPEEMLLRSEFDLLDPARCTIEILETVPNTPEVVAACEALRDRGFTIALDDFAGDASAEPMLKLAQIVKLSVTDHTEDELARAVERLQPYGLTLLAEKIETREMLDRCRGLGFQLFQGYYFSKPETIRRGDIPAGMVNIARLMNMVADPDMSDVEVEMACRADPGLSFKLLRIVNSAAQGGRSVESILHAIQLVGRGPLHRWLAVLFVAATPRQSDIDQELILSALERGRLCELIAEKSGRKSVAASLFLTGLLSTFNSILGVSMEELLNRVHVSPEVQAALLQEEGPYTPHLALAQSYERGDWTRVIDLGGQMGLTDALPEWYGDAAGWARGLLASH